MKRRLLTPLVLLTAGCTMGPDYRRPELDLPAQHRDQQAPAAATASLGELDWWSLYRDPALRSLLHAALASNHDLRIAVTRIEQARAMLGATRVEQLPNADARAGLSYGQAPAHQVPAGADRTGALGSLSLGLSWELDFWGRLRRGSEAARADLLASQYSRRAAQITLIAEVATAYMQLVTLDEQLAITRATVITREEFLKLTRAQSQSGVASALDVAAAEAQLAATQTNVPELERQIAQTENALSLLLGRNPGPIARTAQGLPTALAAPEVPAGLPSSLLERRPDLRQAEQNLVAANARVGVAKAALFPTLSLTGALGAVTPDLSQLFSSSAQTWSAGVGLLQPLLDPARNVYQVDLADARKREAIVRYEQAVKSAFREVADALVAKQKYAELERWQTALVEAQSRAESLATSRYRAGYSSYFDVINAGRDLFDAQLALSSARLRALLATVQLYRALGGGWQVPAAVAVPTR